MKRLLAAIVSVFVLAGCTSSNDPKTHAFTPASNTSAMTPNGNGGVLYTDRLSGDIWSTDKNGKRSDSPVAHVAVSTGSERGLLGVADDHNGDTYAAYTAPDGTLTVSDVSTSSTRVIWTGPVVADKNIGGQIAITPTSRILIGVGDLGDQTKINDVNAPNGKMLTLSPDGTADQRPNPISKGYTLPKAFAYDQSGLLWVADTDPAGKSTLARAGDNGSTGKVTPLPINADAVALSPYGDQELVACLSGSHKVQRYSLQDAAAVTGRVIANDCTTTLAQLSGGQLVYAADTGLRVTAL